MLLASAWSTAPCPAMMFVYAWKAASGATIFPVTWVRSPAMPLICASTLSMAAVSGGVEAFFVADEVSAALTVTVSFLVALTALWNVLRLAASG